jgi:hypothetical protein
MIKAIRLGSLFLYFAICFGLYFYLISISTTIMEWSFEKSFANIPHVVQSCKTSWGLTCTTMAQGIMTLHWAGR